MKAVVLAAGEGKRMRPVSDFVPKEMIPILGKPVLHYVVAGIADAGADGVVIVTNERKLPLIKELVAQDDPGVEVEYAVQREPLGPAHALLQARPRIDSQHFLVHYGDNLAEGNISRDLMDELSRNPGADSVVALREVDDTSRYGIVRLAGGRISEIVEKPKPGTEPSRLAVLGAYVLRTDSFFRSIEGTVFEYQKEQFPPQYVLRAGGTVAGLRFDREWIDLGKPEDMLRASMMLSPGPISCVLLVSRGPSPSPTLAEVVAALGDAAPSGGRTVLSAELDAEGGLTAISGSGQEGGLVARLEGAADVESLLARLAASLNGSEILVVSSDYPSALLPAAKLGMHVLMATGPGDLAPLRRLP